MAALAIRAVTAALLGDRTDRRQSGRTRNHPQTQACSR